MLRVARRWRLLTAVLVAVVMIGLAGFGWFFADDVLRAGSIAVTYDVEVLNVDGNRVTLEATDSSTQPGEYTLEWRDGEASLGPIVATGDDDTVVRRWRPRRGRGRLREGLDARVTHALTGDPRTALSLDFRDVKVPGPTGPLPAWEVPASGPVWVVVVHGRSDGEDGRETALRYLPAPRRLGAPVLVTTYRNDAGAPKSKDGLYRYGLTEWSDVDAAVRYAERRGATGVVLVGESMGGALVAQFLARSPRRTFVRGVVLDAPVLDLSRVIDFGMRRRGIPLRPLLRRVGSLAVRLRAGVRIGELDATRHAAAFTMPVLLVHGDADTAVPVTSSDRFARTLGPRVEYLRVRGADHVNSWAVDPVGTDAAYQRLLSGAGASHMRINR